MKVLKILGAVLGVLLLIFFVMGLMAPKEFLIERSVAIDASKEKIFPHLVNFAQSSKWSPWAELDPDAKTEIVGTDGREGTIYKWDGNDQMGAGQQTITKVDAPHYSETHLAFTRPYESEADSYFKLDDAGKATEVTWGLKGTYGFVESIMMMLMVDMEKEVGSSYEKGLNKLKTIVESEADSGGDYAIERVNLPAKTYMATRKKISFAEMQPFMAKHFGALYTAAQQNTAEMNGSPSCIYYEWDEANKMTDVAVALPVSKTFPMSDEYKAVELAAAPALLINYHGGYHGLAGAHYAMDDYMNTNNLMVNSAVVEEYVTDPQTEADSSKWHTRIYYYYADKDMAGSDN